MIAVDIDTLLNSHFINDFEESVHERLRRLWILLLVIRFFQYFLDLSWSTFLYDL